MAGFIGNLGEFGMRTGDWDDGLAEIDAALTETWEGFDRMGLVATALRQRAAEESLQQVVWLGLGPSDGMTLRSARGSIEPLTSAELDRLRTDLDAAASDADAQLRRLDILKPNAHAWAVSLHVDEAVPPPSVS